MLFQVLPVKLSVYSPINEKIKSKQIFCITQHKLADLFSNGSISLHARLLRLQYFALASETQEIINMTCQTIEHNDLSLIPSARESLMFLLQKINVLHIGATLTGMRRAVRSENTSNTCRAKTRTHTHTLDTLVSSSHAVRN